MCQGQAQESQLMKMRKKAKALESENQDLRIQLRMAEGRRNSVRGIRFLVGSLSGMLGDKTMDDKLMSIPNNDE